MSAIDTVLQQSAVPFEKIAREHQLVKWAEESQFAHQAFQRNTKLHECTKWSVQDAIINIAAVGLTLNPAFGYAYLVPEYDSSLKETLCHLRISFKGLIKVATDSGVISWIVTGKPLQY